MDRGRGHAGQSFCRGNSGSILLRAPRFRPTTRYFLVLALAGNLFTGTGYFFFSGVANFGDWAAVISGLHPYWMWRLGLVVLGAATYYASMMLVAAQLRAFRGRDSCSTNLRALCWTPYVTDGVLAGVASLFNPAGFVLRHRLGSAVNFGSECGTHEPAKHRVPQLRYWRTGFRSIWS